MNTTEQVKMRENLTTGELGSVTPRLRAAAGVRFVGLADVAKRVGCHKLHLSAVLHGRRKANDRLRRELLALGISRTADGERI